MIRINLLPEEYRQLRCTVVQRIDIHVVVEGDARGAAGAGDQAGAGDRDVEGVDVEIGRDRDGGLSDGSKPNSPSDRGKRSIDDSASQKAADWIPSRPCATNSADESRRPFTGRSTRWTT